MRAGAWMGIAAPLLLRRRPSRGKSLKHNLAWKGVSVQRKTVKPSVTLLIIRRSDGLAVDEEGHCGHVLALAITDYAEAFRSSKLRHTRSRGR